VLPSGIGNHAVPRRRHPSPWYSVTAPA
jgi:hypothetical protein